ncbi:hypothetical protein AND_000326 [Anopheles darlingi]|uniref:Uncharacterized protein n=1 Tax=Anopheles darlingi TaxID=43151 RepID=W5JU20_ANODA|nr:hypothetical protein AND_000326 [Anopheles darlingi]
MELGDRRPSELFADMKRTANNTLGETVLVDLWASRFPAQAQAAVIAFRGTIAEKMAVADAIIDSLSLRAVNAAGPSRVHAVVAPANPEIAVLRQMVTDLARVQLTDTLYAANGTPIKTCGETLTNLNINLRRDYLWNQRRRARRG